MVKTRYLFSGFLLVLTIGLCACGGKEWAKEEKDKLLDRCKAEGGSKAYCKCYLNNAMAEYPNPADMEKNDFESAVELSLDCP